MAATQEGENLPIVKKKLNDLRVVDLRAELDKRQLDKTGVKVSLIERLTKALEDEGLDPEEYLFEVTGEVTHTPAKKIQSKRVNKKLTNETESVVSAEGLDDSIIDDEDKIDSDDEKLAIDEKDDSFKDSNQKATIDEKGVTGEKQRNSSSSETKKNSDAKLSNNNSVFSSPKTESVAGAATSTTADDTVNADVSGVVKSIDNASLIVHVDDTQSDVDGDLDLTMCDTVSVSGKGTPVNAEAAGNRETNVGKLLEEADIIDDNDQTGDSNEVLELENEDEEEQPATETKKTIKKETVLVNNSGTNSAAASASTTIDAKKPESKKSSETHHDAKEGAAKENAESGAANLESNNATSASSKSKSASTSGSKEKVSDKDRSSSDRVKRVSVSSCNLWVSGLSASTKASDLRMLFSKYGRIIAAKIVSNAKMPGRRCYGFITMFSSEEASKCIQHLHRTELNGKMISVERTKNTLPGVMKTTKSAPASRKPPPRPHSKPSPESKKPEKPKSEPETETPEKKEKEPVKEEEKKEKPAKTVVVDAAEPSSGETKERDKSTDKSREKSREKSTRDQSRERVRGMSRTFRDPRSGSARGSHYRDYRSRMGRGRPYGSRGRGRGGIMSSRGGMMHNDRGSFRKPFFSRRPMTSAYKPRGNMLTFQKIKEERLKQRQRQRERELRETERRRVQDMLRQKEIERKQREEALRLERERERLRIDREKLERERENILRLEREKQKLERERLEREREELRRREQLRLDEPRRTATKRTFETRTNVRESEPYWDERKRPARAAPGTTSRFHDFEHGGRSDRVSSFERHDTFDRRGTERFEKGERQEFDTLHRPGSRRGETVVPVREDRKVIEREHRFERPLAKEEFRGGREREVRGGNRPIRDPPIRRPPANDGWKSGSHDRRITDISRNDRDRYLVSGKGAVGVSSTGTYGGSGGRSYGNERETWSGSERSVGKSYGSSTGLLNNPHWGSSDSRKIDSSHSQSWSSQSDRWGGASSLEARNTRGQQSLGGQGVLSQPQSSLYSSSVTPVISHSLGSSYGSDRYLPSMRRYN